MNRLLTFVLLCGAAHVACGQKGPPLAPIVYLPRAVTEVVAKRVEDEVVLQFTVPTLNTDGSGPADLRKVEVYAHTGPLPAPTDFLKYGTLIASVEIKQPKTEEEMKAESEEKAATGETGGVGATGATGAVGVVGAAGASDLSLLDQGAKTAVREALTPKHREIGPMPPTRPVPPPADGARVVVVERLETPGTVNFELPPQRFYTIVGVSESRNRRGPYFGPIAIALLEPLSPPQKLDAEYTAEAVSLIWPGQPEDIVAPVPPVGGAGSASAMGAVGATGAMGAGASGATGATGALGATGAPGATGAVSAPGATGATNAGGATSTVGAPVSDTAVVPPLPIVAAAPPLDRETEGTFELYADVETDATEDVLVAAAEKAGASGIKPKPRPELTAPPPPTPRFGYNVYEVGPVPGPSIAPLNATLLTSPGFTDPRVEFGVERCYVVRRVEMTGPIATESAPSAPTCVTPVDTFPPAPPKSLAHIAASNGVSLLWEASTEPDLGGYLVLRGEAPGDKLSPLTPEPISDTSFLDTTARRGRTYVYEVIAVDRSTPPNQSAPSNRVEETIR